MLRNLGVYSTWTLSELSIHPGMDDRDRRRYCSRLWRTEIEAKGDSRQLSLLVLFV